MVFNEYLSCVIVLCFEWSLLGSIYFFLTHCLGDVTFDTTSIKFKFQSCVILCNYYSSRVLYKIPHGIILASNFNFLNEIFFKDCYMRVCPYR